MTTQHLFPTPSLPTTSVNPVTTSTASRNRTLSTASSRSIPSRPASPRSQTRPPLSPARSSFAQSQQSPSPAPSLAAQSQTMHVMDIIQRFEQLKTSSSQAEIEHSLGLPAVLSPNTGPRRNPLSRTASYSVAGAGVGGASQGGSPLRERKTGRNDTQEEEDEREKGEGEGLDEDEGGTSAQDVDGDLEEGEIPQTTAPTSPSHSLSADASRNSTDKLPGVLHLPKTRSTTSDAPLSSLIALAFSPSSTLSPRDRAGVVSTIRRLGISPSPVSSPATKLPLAAGWTLHFSDTSSTKPASAAHAIAHASIAHQYSSAMVPLFTARDLPTLTGHLKTLKKWILEKMPPPRAEGGKSGPAMGIKEVLELEGKMGLGVGRLRQGMNLHFFREDVRPVWEDEWNSKGGRITISPPTSLIDPTFMTLLLIIAGNLLPSTAPPSNTGTTPAPSVPPTPSTPGPRTDGTVLGLVASRRNRGDRLEIWLAGSRKATPASAEWVERLKEAIVNGIKGPEPEEGEGAAEGEGLGAAEEQMVQWVKAARYKKHIS